MRTSHRSIQFAAVLFAALAPMLAGCGNRETSSNTAPEPVAPAPARVKTPLHNAAGGGHVGTVEDLVRGGTDVNARDETGKTPLHYAAANGHEQTVDTLLALGADARAVDDDGHMPRYYAELNGHQRTAEKLPAGRDAASNAPAENGAPDSESTAATPAGQGMKPGLKYADAEAFGSAIGEPACELASEHVQLFAPKTREKEAGIVFPYLVKAYGVLHDIVGRDTEYVIVIYNFPKGHPDAFGGTSNCVLYYDDANLRLENHDEWRQCGVPHLSGYIEEMAHNFVGATKAQFGWEMVGWSLGVKATAAVGDNPIFAEQVSGTRKMQTETFDRYVAGGYVFPADIESNLVDRIHAHLLWQCERAYGGQFWPDFFREINREYGALRDAVQLSDGDAIRNARYQITVDCFDRLPGLHFKDRLREAHISLGTDVKSLHPTEPGWDRRLS